MRQICSLLILMGSLSGCGSRSTQTEATATDSSTATQSKTVCFEQVEGRDSTMLQLVINGSSVTGELAVLPFEKDRARGPIQGTLANNQIQADWQRSGEGTTQPYEMIFTLKGDSVTWREGERIEKQGKWVLKTPDQGYQYTLTKTECR